LLVTKNVNLNKLGVIIKLMQPLEQNTDNNNPNINQNPPNTTSTVGAVAQNNVNQVAPTPPNIPQSQLKNYIDNQTNLTNNNNTAASQNKSFELTIVAVQAICIAVILLDFFSPLLLRSTTLMLAGAVLIGVGVAFAVWARLSFMQHMKIFPSPNEKGFLVTGGPYALVRHPVYSGLILACLGLLLIFPTIGRIIAFLALIFVLNKKIKYEEMLLSAKYNGYQKYIQSTNKLIPRIHR
jgi:protein-S-isoprenylcysteine O-methyltransferase Ste14